jgi:hypothetical protein
MTERKYKRKWKRKLYSFLKKYNLNPVITTGFFGTGYHKNSISNKWPVRRKGVKNYFQQFKTCRLTDFPAKIDFWYNLKTYYLLYCMLLWLNFVKI